MANNASAQGGITSIDLIAKQSDRLFNVYIVVLIVSGLIIGILTWLMRRADSSLQEAIRTEGNARIQEANAVAALAKKDAADARLEQERIKAQLAWRTLPPSASSELSRLLSSTPGTAKVAYTSNDPEALNLAIQIGNALVNGKWNVVRFESRAFQTKLFFGIFINGDSIDATNLRGSFRRAEIGFST
jgi:hypothetical protein